MQIAPLTSVTSFQIESTETGVIWTNVRTGFGEEKQRCSSAIYLSAVSTRAYIYLSGCLLVSDLEEQVLQPSLKHEQIMPSRLLYSPAWRFWKQTDGEAEPRRSRIKDAALRKHSLTVSLVDNTDTFSASTSILVLPNGCSLKLDANISAVSGMLLLFLIT